MEVYSLFELNEHVRRVIALNFQDPLWVKCEISQVRQSRGHYYLELVEKVPDHSEVLAQASAVIWAKTAWILQRKLKDIFHELLQDGMEIRLKVRVDFHERYGLKLVIEDIDPAFTLGNIEVKRREIIETLLAAGLLRKNAEHALPMVLQRIAVLSAEKAAGYFDFRNHILQNSQHFRYSIDLYPIAMQGVFVERELVKAMESIAHAQKHYDCIVIIRGGGSRLDLSAFDSLEIGKAIAHAPLPVFTGIGHEIDHTVADSVAHTTLKTPTAVADFITEINTHFDSRVHQLLHEIAQIAKQRVHSSKMELKHIAELLLKKPDDLIQRRRFMLDQVEQTLRSSGHRVVSQHQERLSHMHALLTSLDPLLILQRGFSITTINNRRIKAASEAADGDTLITHLYQGQIQSTVTSHE